MRSIWTRVAALGLIALAIALFAVLKDDSADDGGSTVSTTTATQPLQIEIKDGEPVGGVRKLTVKKGNPIRFTVSSDVSDEVHLHGYNVAKDVEAGASVSFDLLATLEGVFEAELERRKTEILELTVEP